MHTTYPEWATTPELKDYYDNEWGIPVRDEQGLYERICLEAFQVGLSWSLVLKRRDALRAAFAGFNPDIVSTWRIKDMERVIGEPGVIKNSRKIRACVVNAIATVGLRKKGGLPQLVWSHAPATWAPPTATREARTSAPEATELAADLKKANFTFVGPTTCFALMEACGLVDNRIHE